MNQMLSILLSPIFLVGLLIYLAAGYVCSKAIHPISAAWIWVKCFGLPSHVKAQRLVESNWVIAMAGATAYMIKLKGRPHSSVYEHGTEILEVGPRITMHLYSDWLRQLTTLTYEAVERGHTYDWDGSFRIHAVK